MKINFYYHLSLCRFSGLNATNIHHLYICCLCSQSTIYLFFFLIFLNSFLEAEYAKKLQKIIIPCKLERGYDAKGWLGFLIGSKLFFDFSGKYPFEKKMEDLLREINIRLNRNSPEALAKEIQKSLKTDDAVANKEAGMVEDYCNLSSIKVLSKILIYLKIIKNVAVKSIINVSCLSMLSDMYVERIVNGHTNIRKFYPFEKKNGTITLYCNNYLHIFQ